jgi:ParB-like chromosome segregation protein Spo0J
MSTLQISYKSTENLIPYANNSRTHSDDQINQVASSIKEFGFTNPVLIDEQGGIIAGHGRVMAAKKLGLAEVPTITLEGLTKAQLKAYVIADNKLALNSGWDVGLLSVELEALGELGFDFGLLGFDETELSNLFDKDDILVEPDLKEQTYNEVFNIIIECFDESEQEKIFNRLDQEGYKCRVQSL